MKIKITEKQFRLLNESKDNSLDKTISQYEEEILKWRYNYAVKHHQEFFDAIFDNFLNTYLESAEYRKFQSDLEKSKIYRALIELYKRKYPNVNAEDIETDIFGEFNLHKDAGGFDFIYDLKLIPKKPNFDSLVDY